MRPSTIVVANPLTEYPPQVTFAKWDQKIQTFSPNRADQTFAKCVEEPRERHHPETK